MKKQQKTGSGGQSRRGRKAKNQNNSLEDGPSENIQSSLQIEDLPLHQLVEPSHMTSYMDLFEGKSDVMDFLSQNQE
ncbi:hypothetical protein GQ55_9G504700 [Panicum hallii var. hallii]|uniref:Uncharacterized protein n=1 Tax=Panicum hallii var. hallii TaxID=1504633 RepID=A0A2T7CDL0_9POAL|nr:hypothetical protein GQ55_9G504700 [Panicum hallii var. hallii]